MASRKNKAAKPKPKPQPEVVEAVAEVDNPNPEHPGDQGDDDDGDEGMPVLFIGEPFALAGVDGAEDESDAQDGQFLEENPESGVPGCFASVMCGCGQPFKIDLLTADVKACPGCDARYTHMLVIGAESDTRIVGHTWHHLLTVNGLLVDPDAEADDGDDGAQPAAGIPDAK